jgi:hypothetical protein
MSKYMIVQPDPFATTSGQFLKTDRGKTSAGWKASDFSHVRRPYRGFQLKAETYATLEVVRADGTPIPLLNSSVHPSGSDGLGRGPRYSNFILQSISEQRMERKQIVETFGESWIFFSGQSPVSIQCQAVLLNSADFQWKNEFWRNYDENLRGTKCAQNGARVYLSWGDDLVEGYMVSAQASESPNPQFMAQLGFEILVTKHDIMATVGDTQFPGESWDLANESDSESGYSSRMSALGFLEFSPGTGIVPSVNWGGLISGIKDTIMSKDIWAIAKKGLSGSADAYSRNNVVLPKSLRRTSFYMNADEYPMPGTEQAKNWNDRLASQQALMGRPEFAATMNGFLDGRGMGFGTGMLATIGGVTTSQTFGITKLWDQPPASAVEAGVVAPTWGAKAGLLNGTDLI